MHAVLFWGQSYEERYESDQNAMIEELLKTFGVEVVGTAGGMGVDGEGDNEIDVEGARMDIKSAHGILQDALKREVGLKWVYPWTRPLAELKWKLYYRPLIAWQQRKAPPSPQCTCPPDALDKEEFDFDASLLYGDHHLNKCPLYWDGELFDLEAVDDDPDSRSDS